MVLGSICGLRNISQIHQWAESDSVIGFLKEEFGIEHILCYYWLVSLLKLVKLESLNKCLMKWAAAMLSEERKGLTVSLDGKTVRSTCKMESYDSPLHIISAQISELGSRLHPKAQNLNMLRKFTLSIIKQFKADSNSKRPLSQIMFNCLLNPSGIWTILEN